MKRLLLIVVIAFGSVLAKAQDGPKVYNTISDYLKSIVANPVDTINARIDSLIAQAAPDTAAQATIAGLAFDFFSTSPYMGQEAVAVHVADNYFLNHRLKWADDSTFPQLYAFAQFNRSSLVGMSAPELRMEDLDYNPRTLRLLHSHFKVLFFYDTQCSNCRKQTASLVELLKNYHGPQISLYAVYTQSDRESWAEYAAKNFAQINNPDVLVYNVWDPQLDSDFQRKYGVLTTPSMFLIDSQNIIRGRKLDADALGQMLSLDEAESRQFASLFDKLFESMAPLQDGDALLIADAFARRTSGDSTMYRKTMSNLFDYCRSSQNYLIQKGAIDIAVKYIAGAPAYWSDEYLGMIVHQVELENRNPIGSKAMDAKLYDHRGRTRHLLDCDGVYHLILFHLVDCEDCQKIIEELRHLRYGLDNAEVAVTLVYVGRDKERWKEFVKKSPKTWRYLWDYNKKNSVIRDLYDLEIAPHVYLLDGSDTVIGKDFKITELKAIMNYL